jgi:NADH-quinone oxidoreductase subunit J
MTLLHVIFIITAAVTLISAGMVVTTRMLMHAALWLILTLLGVAVLFALLGTRFFVVVQVMIYIGAIAILIIFGVMLTRRIMQDTGPQLNRGWWLAALVVLILFASLIWAISSWQNFNVTTNSITAGGENLLLLGNSFVDPSGFLIPFEVASILLLAALIGSIFIAMERR